MASKSDLTKINKSCNNNIFMPKKKKKKKKPMATAIHKPFETVRFCGQ